MSGRSRVRRCAGQPVVDDDRGAEAPDHVDRAFRRLHSSRSGREVLLLLGRRRIGAGGVRELVDDDHPLVRVLRQPCLVDGPRRRRQERRLGRAERGLRVGQGEAALAEGGRDDRAGLGDRGADRALGAGRRRREGRDRAVATGRAARDGGEHDGRDGHRDDRRGAPHPGGHSNGRPPIRWRCR